MKTLYQVEAIIKGRWTAVHVWEMDQQHFRAFLRHHSHLRAVRYCRNNWRIRRLPLPYMEGLADFAFTGTDHVALKPA